MGSGCHMRHIFNKATSSLTHTRVQSGLSIRRKDGGTCFPRNKRQFHLMSTLLEARVTKLVPSICHKGYQRRLADLGLFTPEHRRLRGLLIETFKILRGFMGWTRPPCLNCPLIGGGTTVISWCRPGSTLCSTVISQRL